MGIYYYAVDTLAKLYFGAPVNYSDKSPGIYHPNNPFPHMLVMKNIQGYFFEVWNDCSNDIPPDDDYVDVTEKVYKEYLDEWPIERKSYGMD